MGTWICDEPRPLVLAALLLLLAPAAGTVDRLVVLKSKHTLTLYSHGAVVKTYNVGLGRQAGAKEFQGDQKTPEGHYVIDGHNAKSSFHLSLHISYPNEADRARAAQMHKLAGGDIMLHGLPRGAGVLGPLQHMYDWTSGCVALSNAEIDEVYRLVPNGTPIDILP